MIVHEARRQLLVPLGCLQACLTSTVSQGLPGLEGVLVALQYLPDRDI